MMEYPYTTSQILTDSIFVKFGGQIGTSTTFQREAAYLLAEDVMTEHLGSFLVPTTITGSIHQINGTLFATEFGHVRQVYSVYFDTIYSAAPLTLQVTTGSALIRDSEHGYIDVFVDCNYGADWLYRPYAAYQSGLYSGTSTQPPMLAALTMAAQIQLNEMDVSLSNEGVADAGIQRFSNQAYSEERVKLGHTVFGNSAMAQRIARLVKRYRSKPAVLLR